jgi:hypothetical protein
MNTKKISSNDGKHQMKLIKSSTEDVDNQLIKADQLISF